MPKPIPIPNNVSRPFWEAANTQRLVAQFCNGCHKYQHPPQAKCAKCGAEKLEFRQLSGKGRIYSLQVMHDTRVGAMPEYHPFIIALIEVDESPDVQMMTNLPGSEPGTAKINDPVKVEFEEIAPGKLIPQFRAVR